MAAPAAPPTTAPIMAPVTVLPAALPMAAPAAAPPAAPILPPLAVLLHVLQPLLIIATRLKHKNKTLSRLAVFIINNFKWLMFGCNQDITIYKLLCSIS